MLLQAFPSGPFETNAYLIACPETLKAVIIDPAPGSYRSITEKISNHQLKPIAIWLTHSHWDHIADTAKLKETYKIPVLIHPLDAPNLETPGADLLPCWIPFDGVHPTKLINEGDLLAVGNIQFQVIHTPGHSPGGVCFYCANEGILISGDTLFKGTIGNLSFPTSRPDLMWSSLDKLAKLPPATHVFPGHGPSTTIGNESWLPRAEELFGQ